MRNLIKLKYTKYPKIYELVSDRYARYNETLQFLDEEEKAGRAFVIRPQRPNDIGRVEKDRKKLEVLYELGYRDAKKRYDELMEFLQQESLD